MIIQPNALIRPLNAIQSSPVGGSVLKNNPVESPATVGEKVTLSSEAQKFAAMPKTGVEQYALPSWFTEFSPSFSIVSNEADRRHEEVKKYTAFHEQLAADGSISWKDEQALRAYVNTMMPTNTARNQIQTDYIQNQALYKEYGQIHNQYLQEGLSEQGIITQADWDDKVKNAPDENQALRLSVMEKMFGNPRAMELMSLLGIPKPAV